MGHEDQVQLEELRRRAEAAEKTCKKLLAVLDNIFTMAPDGSEIKKTVIRNLPYMATSE